MHHRAALCAALLVLSATVAHGAVRHYVFGLDPQSAYDVWQGDQLIAQGTIPGPAGDIEFESASVSPVSVLPNGSPPDLLPPSAVTDLDVTNTTESTATLSWTAVGDDGNQGQASTYDLRYATYPITPATWNAANQVAGEPIPKPAGGAETFTVTGLAPGTTYYFALKVADEVPNWSDLSNVPSGTTEEAGDAIPPSEVTDLLVSQTTTTTATLTWTAVGDDGNTGQASSYDLRYATTPITSETWATANQVDGEPNPKPAGQAETFTVTGLTPETNYYFAVKVADEVPNWSGLSNVASGITSPEADLVPPAEVTNLSVSNTTSSSATLTWSAVGDDGNQGQASVYDLRYDTSPITTESWSGATQVEGEPNPKPAGQAETFVVHGLSAETSYYFAMKVADEVPNWSGLSNIAQGTTQPPGDTAPPAEVTDLGVVASTETSVTLTWTAVGDDGQEGQATTYDLRYDTTPITEETWGAASQAGGEPDPGPAGQAELFTIEALEAATHYYFAVKVADEIPNWSGLSNILEAETLPEGEEDVEPPAAIENLQVTWAGDNSIALGWTASGDDGNEGQANTYDIRYDTTPITTETWATATQAEGEPNPKPAGQAENFVIHGLVPSSDYYFALKVADEVPNWSGLSNVASGTTLDEDLLAPADVNDLTLADTTQTSVTLTWTAVGDDGQEGQAAGYDLRYATAPITEESWEAATQVEGEPSPQPAGGSESFTIESLEPGTTYSIALKVRDDAMNWSGLSNILQGTTGAPPIDDVPPSRVLTLEVVTTTQDTATLTWIAVGDDGEAGQASSYDIRRATSPIDGESWETATELTGEPDPQPAGEVELFEATGLEPNTTYYFALIVADEVPNWSDLSNVASATTSPIPDLSAPDPVIDLEPAGIGHRFVQLIWTAPADDEETESVTSYTGRFDIGPIDEETWEIATPIEDLPAPSAPGETDSVLIEGLQPGTTYFFAIRAVDEAGNTAPIGSVAEVSTTSAPDTVPPARITDLVPSDVTMTTITVRWHAPADSIPPDCLETPEVARYEFRFSTSSLEGDGWETGIPVEAPDPAEPGTAQELVVEGLLPDTDYFFAIRALDARGNRSEISNVAAQATSPPDELPDSIDPGEISDLSVASVTFDGVVLSWTAPGGDGDEGQADHYDVRRAFEPLTGEVWENATALLPPPPCGAAGEPETLRVEGLEPEATYYFAMRAIDAAGNRGPISTSVEARTLITPDTSPPQPVTDLEALEADSSSVLLRWTAPDDDRGSCASYELRYATAGIDEATWESATPVEDLPVPAQPGQAESFRIGDLPAGTSFAFALRASDETGNRSALSNVIWAQTDTTRASGDMVPPARIADLIATPLDEHRVLLTWTAVGDDGTEGRASAYELRRSAGTIDSTSWELATSIEIPLTPAEPGEAESFIVTDLAPDTDHHFVVRTLDEAENRSPCSVDALAHTPPIPDTSPPAVPTGLSATLDDDRVLLAWAPSVEPDVAGYVLYRRETSPGSNESVAFLDLEGTEYEDALVLPEVEYAYTLVAKDAAGNLSQESTEVLVQTRLEGFLPEILDFAAESTVEVSEETGQPRVRLLWTAVAGRRFAGFIVERSDDTGTTWALRTASPLTGEESFAYEELIDPGTYLYRITALSPRGYARSFDPIAVQWDDAITENTIEGPYPNPSAGAMTVRFRLAKTEQVRVLLYDLSGRRVGLLHDAPMSAGVHPWRFDPTEGGGRPLAAGLYFLRIEAGSDRFVRKVVVRR